MKLAFQKKGDGFFGWLIRKWTDSPYSHVEIVFMMDEYEKNKDLIAGCEIQDGEFEYCSLWFSASPSDGGTRFKWGERSDKNFDYLDLPSNNDQVRSAIRYAVGIEGRPYDWKGIMLAHFLGGGREDAFKWFCSEAITSILQVVYLWFKGMKPSNFNPDDVYEGVIIEDDYLEWEDSFEPYVPIEP